MTAAELAATAAHLTQYVDDLRTAIEAAGMPRDTPAHEAAIYLADRAARAARHAHRVRLCYERYIEQPAAEYTLDVWAARLWFEEIDIGGPGGVCGYATTSLLWPWPGKQSDAYGAWHAAFIEAFDQAGGHRPYGWDRNPFGEEGRQWLDEQSPEWLAATIDKAWILSAAAQYANQPHLPGIHHTLLKTLRLQETVSANSLCKE